MVLSIGIVKIGSCAEKCASQQTASQQAAPEGGVLSAASLVEQREDAGVSSSAAAGEQQRLRELPDFITERVRDVRTGNAVVGSTHLHVHFALYGCHTGD